MKTKTLAIFIGILFFTGCQNLKEVDTTVYMDPIRPVEERVEALLEQMTLEEKIGQMDIVSEWDQDSIMKAGYYDFGAWIAGQEPEAANLLQSFSEKTRLKIPYLIMLICLNDLFACLGLAQTRKLLTNFSKNSFYLLPEPLRLGEFLMNYC